MSTSPRTLYLVFLLWFSGLCAAAQFAKIAIPFSYVKAIYPHAGSELGWLLSLISLAGALLGVVAGSLVGRVGSRRILLFGMVLGAVISIWQALLPAFSIMLVSRIIEGVSHLAIVVAAPTLIAQISSSRYRAAAMALWSTFFGVSFALVAWLGMLIVTNGSLEALFVVHSALMLTAAVLLAVGLKEHENSFVKNRLPRASELIRIHAEAYRSPSISAPGIGWLFYTLTFVSLLTILPLQFEEDTGSRIAGIMSAVSIVSAMVLVPIFCDKIQASMWS